MDEGVEERGRGVEGDFGITLHASRWKERKLIITNSYALFSSN